MGLSVGTAKPIIEEEEELVDYEDWMNDYGRKPDGIEFDADDLRAVKYPELWLDQSEIDVIKQRLESEEEDKKKQKAAAEAKKQKKSKKNSKKNTGTVKKKKVNVNKPPVIVNPP